MTMNELINNRRALPPPPPASGKYLPSNLIPVFSAYRHTAPRNSMTDGIPGLFIGPLESDLMRGRCLRRTPFEIYTAPRPRVARRRGVCELRR
jgi:hypothetical protein